MRRHVLLLLVAANLALAALLAWLWLTPQGQWRGVHWEPPQPVRPALADAPALPAFEVDLGRYVATLERPLFAPSRRPPPPPQAAASAPASEPMPDIRLLGLYGSSGAGGVIASIDGKVRRLRVGESVGGWSLKELRAGEIVIGRGDEVRTLRLTRSTGGEPAPTTAAAGTSAPAVSSATPSAADAYKQSELERVRTQVRRMNVLRARSGMPPLPEP